MVISRGDAIAGAIMLLLADRGVSKAIVERVWRFEGGHGLERVGPGDLSVPGLIGEYVERRRRSDPDLWVVELDHYQAEEIAREMLG